MEKSDMSESTQEKPLARQRFLALIGASAFGIWLTQLMPSMPSGLSALKLPLRRKSPVSNQLASRVKVHPLAVKRENPVRRDT